MGAETLLRELFMSCWIKLTTETVRPNTSIRVASPSHMLDKLLELNDVLNNVIEQYKEVKGGNLVKMPLPNEGDNQHDNQSRDQAPSTPKQNSSLIDLVDFDGSSDGSRSSATTPKTTGSIFEYSFYSSRWFSCLMPLSNLIAAV